MRSARKRSGFTTGGGGGGGTTTINAQLVNYGSTTSGTLRFTGIFEVPPGLLTEAMISAKEVAIWKGGSEVACHIEAARGHHPGGTHVRGFRYDFDYAVSNASPVTGFTVVIGTARGSTDISRRTIVQSQFTARRWMVATDPSYLVTTWATGMPLVEASSWNAHETAWLKTLADAAIVARDTQPDDASKAGSATYNAARVFKNLYLCTGDPSYLNEVWKSAKRWLDVYHLPTGTDPYGGYGETTQIDVESLGRYAEAFAEPYSVVDWDFPLLYMLTGWSYPWLLANSYGQRATRAAAISATNNFNGQYGVRFNLRYIRHAATAQRFDCTYIYANPDYGPRTADFAAELPNILSAADYNKYDTSRGAYRANLRGQHTGLVNADLGWGAGNGDLPNFWLSVMNDFLIDYYHTIYADSRIPGWVATNFNIVVANAATLPGSHYYVASYGADPTKWAVPYRQTSTASTSNSVDGGPAGSDGNNDPFDLCMHARAAAFLNATDGGATYNGKTAAQWLDIMTTPGQMSGMVWKDKFIGETFQAMSMPYYRLNGDPGGPASIHAPTVHTGAPT